MRVMGNFRRKAAVNRDKGFVSRNRHGSVCRIEVVRYRNGDRDGIALCVYGVRCGQRETRNRECVAVPVQCIAGRHRVGCVRQNSGRRIRRRAFLRRVRIRQNCGYVVLIPSRIAGDGIGIRCRRRCRRRDGGNSAN